MRYLLRVMALLLCVMSLMGCYDSYYIDRDATRIYSTDRKCILGYSWTNEALTLEILDRDMSLAGLRPLAGSGYIWRDGVHYRLLFNEGNISYDGSNKYIQSQDANHYIGFHFKIDNLQTKKINHIKPLPPGRYNISIQFNGIESITSVCGDFEIKSESKTPPKMYQ